jgi:hypothetical protein
MPGCPAGEDVHPFLSAFKFGLRYAFGIISTWEALGWRAVLNPLVDNRAAMEAKFAGARKVCNGWHHDPHLLVCLQAVAKRSKLAIA